MGYATDWAMPRIEIKGVLFLTFFNRGIASLRNQLRIIKLLGEDLRPIRHLVALGSV